MGPKPLVFVVLLLALLQAACSSTHGTPPGRPAPDPVRAANTDNSIVLAPLLRDLVQRADEVTLIASDRGVRKVLNEQEKATLTHLSSRFASTINDRTGEGVYPNLAIELQDGATVTRLTFLLPTLAWDERGWYVVPSDVWVDLCNWLPTESFEPNTPRYLFQATKVEVSWDYQGSTQAGSNSALWRVQRIVRVLAEATPQSNAEPLGEPLGVMTFEIRGVTETVHLWADSFSYSGQAFDSPGVLAKAQAVFNNP